MSESLKRLVSAAAAFKKLPKTPFAKGAHEADIDAAEQQLGVNFPDEFRDYLLAHDGGRYEAAEGGLTHSVAFIKNLEFLPLAVMLDEWQQMIDLDGDMDGIDADGPVKPQFWNPHWVPITLLFGSTQFHCLDLDPDEGGTVGQVIWVADDDESRKVIAPDFDTYLEMLADALESEVESESEEGVELSDGFWDSVT
jgi:cell wall assembly regulator SMI1